MSKSATDVNYYKISDSRFLQPLLRSLLFALLIHWTFQGMLYMDRTERWFKLAFTGITTSICVALFLWLGIFENSTILSRVDNPFVPLILSFVTALPIAHTLNFLLNSQIPVVLKHYRLVQHSHENWEAYANGVIDQANQCQHFDFIAAYGSLSRKQWSPSSDLDLRVIRKAGFWHGLCACCFVMSQRTRALVNRFPLDIYILDDAKSLQKLRSDEEAIIYFQGESGRQSGSEDMLEDWAARQNGSRAALQQNVDAAHNKPSILFLRGADIDSGIGQTDYRIAYAFPALGYQTTLTLLSRRSSRERVDGVDTRTIATPNLPIIKGLWANWATFWQIVRTRVDVMVCNPGMYLCGAAYKIVHPKTFMVLDVRTVPVEIKGIGGWVAEWLFTLAVQSQRLNGLSVISEGIRQDIFKRYQAVQHLPSVIWRSGVDEKLFDPTLSGDAIRAAHGLEDQLVLLFHGSLTLTRGLDLIPPTLALLAEKGVGNVKAVFLGEGPALEPLQAQIAELGVEDQVLFLPPVPHNEVARYVAAADVGLDPLPDNPWWNHSSSMKIYEYLQMGKPILATDIPAHRNLSDAIILFPDGDVAALTEEIRQLTLLPKSERNELTLVALTDGAQNSWHKRAEALSKFIQQQLSDKSSTPDRGFQKEGISVELKNV